MTGTAIAAPTHGTGQVTDIRIGRGGIRVFTPQFSVTLFKIVGRREGQAERYASAQREIDLTPYLGDGGAVRVSKDLVSPSGAFTISFGDQMDAATKDSLAAFIEPMDIIEIRAGHGYPTPSPLPLIMRGFVTAVNRQRKMGDAPSHTVMIQGHDAGKIWTIHRFILEIAYQHPQALALFGLATTIGLSLSTYTVGAFVKAMTEQVINPKIDVMAAFSGQNGQRVRKFTTDRITATQGNIIPAQYGNLQPGPFWSIIDHFADRPWNELFVEDEEAGPAMVLRPAPYKDLSGAFIMPGAQDPGTILVDDVAIMSIDEHRRDDRIANIYWVPPEGHVLEDTRQLTVSSFAAGAPLDFQHPNNRPELYGTKMMTVATNLISPAITGGGQGLPEANSALVDWINLRREQLKAMNRDNGVLVDGAVTMRGHEAIKPGRYLRMEFGDVTSEAYITQVQHVLAPMKAWTTTVAFERGTGFVERQKLAGSPYLQEGAPGIYSAP